MKAPDFWRQGHGGLNAMMLAPFGWIYGFVTETRMMTGNHWKAGAPVICVGNLVAGGAGKTPIAISIVRRLIEAGGTPHFLSRGYGGGKPGTLRVDPQNHGFRDVGDEPLLLSAIAPTWVSSDRRPGCEAAAGAGASAIVMDDGFQNPAVAKDLSLIVVDGGYGFGNGRVIPAGPLRETVAAGLNRAHAVVIIGKDETGTAETILKHAAKMPILHASLEPDAEAGQLSGKPVVAFAGIGRPDKFLATLRTIGADVLAFHSFPDHHPYGTDDTHRLTGEAEKSGARLVTTEKDWVRLPDAFREKVTPVRAAIVWQDEAAIARLLEKVAGHGA